MYAYPTHISDAFLAAIAETTKAVKYLDMPLQHASRNVLKLMKRGGTRKSLEKLIERVREKSPVSRSARPLSRAFRARRKKTLKS